MDTECLVCLVKGEKPLQKHFGGTSCNSCRAFFRRCHHTSLEPPTFKCIDKGSCDFTKIKRHACKSCRYNSCIKNGMKPELVLQGEEAEKFDYSEVRMKKAMERKKRAEEKNLVLVQQQVEKMRLEAQDKCLAQYHATMAQNAQSSHKYMIDLIHLLTSIFMMSCAETPLDPSLVKLVTEGHLNPRDWHHTHTIGVIKIFRNIQEMNGKYCMKSHHFMSLARDDQEALHANNCNLYLHYIIAKYFNGKSAIEQLAWLLGKDAPIFLDPQVLSIPPISIRHFSQTGEFFTLGDPEMIAKFLNCIQDINENFDLPMFYNGLLVHCFLFHNDGTLNLREHNRVQAMFEESKEVIKQSQQGFGCIDRLLKSLSFLESFLSSRRINDPFSAGNFYQEQECAKQMIVTFQNVIDDVSDANLTHRYIKYLRGDRESFAKFICSVQAIAHIRAQFLLEALTRVSISKQERVHLAIHNYESVKILSYIKSECFSGFDNIKKFFLGKKTFEGINLESVKKVDTLGNMVYFNRNISIEDKERFKTSVEMMSNFVEDDDTFVLLSIFMLTSNSGQEEVRFVHGLVIKLLQQRLRSIKLELDISGFIRQMENFKEVSRLTVPK